MGKGTSGSSTLALQAAPQLLLEWLWLHGLRFSPDLVSRDPTSVAFRAARRLRKAYHLFGFPARAMPEWEIAAAGPAGISRGPACPAAPPRAGRSHMKCSSRRRAFPYVAGALPPGAFRGTANTWSRPRRVDGRPVTLSAVVRRPILTPPDQVISITYRADRHPTCAPINKSGSLGSGGFMEAPLVTWSQSPFPAGQNASKPPIA